MVIEHGPHRTESIDDWTSVGDEDDDFCYVCDDWAEDDGHGNCKECGVSFKTIDPFTSVRLLPKFTAPQLLRSHLMVISGVEVEVVATLGVVEEAGGKEAQGVLTLLSGVVAGQQETTDREARMLKHKRHLDSLCKVVDPTVKHTLSYSTHKKNYSNMERGSIFVDGSLLL